MARRYAMDPREFRDMTPEDFMFIRHIYEVGHDRDRLAVASVKGVMPVVVVG